MQAVGILIANRDRRIEPVYLENRRNAMKLTFSISTMDVIMQECRRTETAVATLINRLVDAEAERIRTNMKNPIEGEHYEQQSSRK